MFSIIIPVYRESESLPLLLQEIKDVVEAKDYEVIVVDDSEDDITKINSAPFFVNSSWQYLHREKRLGLSSAVIDGFNIAKGDWLICMDGDGSHSPEMINRFAENLNELNSVLVGSRYTEGGSLDSDWAWLRQVISKSFCLFVRPLTAVTDPMSGCFALKKSLFNQKKSLLSPMGYKILLEILVKFKVNNAREIPLDFRLRFKGNSKITLKIMLESVVHLFKLYKFVIS
ncbi:MAG: glycosyltransferase [Lentisphaerales bacterium]|nr:glycosyltransferase [Lentisphaerales bacterium]